MGSFQNVLLQEFLFWLGFILINGSHYLINYIFDFKRSRFFPYVNGFIEERKLGLAFSENQDFFRYVVELSVFIIISRFLPLASLAGVFTFFYTSFLIFNIYQYSLRKIYECEPNFYGDLKLLKNAIAIIWYESKFKLLSGFILVIAVIYFISFTFEKYLVYSYSIGLNDTYYGFAVIWILSMIWAIYQRRFYSSYPNDIYRRYHFVLLEVILNIQRSFTKYDISQRKIGKAFREKRARIAFGLKENPPNLYFIFVESYGSYFYKEKSLHSSSRALFNSFKEKLESDQWGCISTFSESPTTGGQSWLTYSSMLYGLRIDDNTYFENYLNDPDFNQSNSLLRILKNSGYVNYNLNPIKPINGINVPYKQMRKFYTIDRWVLNDTINYQGDVYGWGDCPPDQYSMNYMAELIREEKASPYTYFYLTKNSHSPFISPELVDEWKELAHSNGITHIHKGFLKHPTKEDYLKSITYELENLNKFIKDNGNGNDIFLIMGDHQPPMLSSPEVHGHETPVHIISKNKEFLESFKEYGFDPNLDNCTNHIKHEAMFSIFLRSFMTKYGKGYESLPEYEPDGIQL